MDELILKNESVELIEQSKNMLVITSQDEANIANEYLQRNKAQQKKLQNEYDPEIKKAHELHKSIKKRRDNILNPLVANHKIVSTAIGSFVLEQERKLKIEEARLEKERQEREAAEKKIIEDAAVKAADENDLQLAEDLLEQSEDHVVAATTPKTQVINKNVTGIGTTTWVSDLVVSVDSNELMAFLKGVVTGALPISCLDTRSIKLGELKKHFKSKGITEYNKYGVTVKETKTPITRTN